MRQRSWKTTSMRQTSEEPFGKIMAAAVKMAEDMNTAVDKSRVAKRSADRRGAANGDASGFQLLPHQHVHSVTGWTL